METTISSIKPLSTTTARKTSKNLNRIWKTVLKPTVKSISLKNRIKKGPKKRKSYKVILSRRPKGSKNRITNELKNENDPTSKKPPRHTGGLSINIDNDEDDDGVSNRNSNGESNSGGRGLRISIDEGENNKSGGSNRMSDENENEGTNRNAEEGSNSDGKNFHISIHGGGNKSGASNRMDDDDQDDNGFDIDINADRVMENSTKQATRKLRLADVGAERIVAAVAEAIRQRKVNNKTYVNKSYTKNSKKRRKQ